MDTRQLESEIRMGLKLVKGNEPKWKRIRPGLYRIGDGRSGGRIERGAETGMWYMLKWSATSGRTSKCFCRLTLKEAKEAYK